MLIFTDVIGHKFINAQLIADQFASNGYLVVTSDLFNGDTVPFNRPEGFNIMEWIICHRRRNRLSMRFLRNETQPWL